MSLVACWSWPTTSGFLQFLDLAERWEKKKLQKETETPPRADADEETDKNQNDSVRWLPYAHIFALGGKCSSRGIINIWKQLLYAKVRWCLEIFWKATDSQRWEFFSCLNLVCLYMVWSKLRYEKGMSHQVASPTIQNQLCPPNPFFNLSNLSWVSIFATILD